MSAFFLCLYATWRLFPGVPRPAFGFVSTFFRPGRPRALRPGVPAFGVSPSPLQPANRLFPYLQKRLLQFIAYSCLQPTVSPVSSKTTAAIHSIKSALPLPHPIRLQKQPLHFIARSHPAKSLPPASRNNPEKSKKTGIRFRGSCRIKPGLYRLYAISLGCGFISLA